MSGSEPEDTGVTSTEMPLGRAVDDGGSRFTGAPGLIAATGLPNKGIVNDCEAVSMRDRIVNACPDKAGRAPQSLDSIGGISPGLREKVGLETNSMGPIRGLLKRPSYPPGSPLMEIAVRCKE